MDAEPCLRAGEAVLGTTRDLEAGRARLFGKLLGHNGTAYRDEHSPRFVRALLVACGVRPAHAGRLLLRKRVTSAAEAWLFVNPLGTQVSEPVDVAEWTEVTTLDGEALPPSEGHVTVTVEPFDVQVLVLRRASGAAAGAP